MSTDRKELNDAIDSVSRAIDGCPNYWDRENTMKVLRTLRTATRAHLATLPEPIWSLSGKHPSNSGSSGRVYGSRDAALDAVRRWLDIGYTDVSVKQVQS